MLPLADKPNIAQLGKHAYVGFESNDLIMSCCCFFKFSDPKILQEQNNYCCGEMLCKKYFSRQTVE